MRNLEDFSPPNSDEIAVCEINGRTQYMSTKSANSSCFTNSIEKHPKIHITRDMLHHTYLGDESRALFLPTEVPFLKQLTQIYSEQGFTEALRTASRHHQLLIRNSAIIMLNLMKSLKKVQLVFNPNLKHNVLDLINDLSQSRHWLQGPIRCIAWHPHSSRLAVATSDDSVRIYCNENNFIPLLRCKRQKNITCLAWRPMSLTEIAVGHEKGIIIWNVDFNSLVARPSVINTIMLHRVEHAPVISIAWSPRGDTLVSAAACDSTILVWDPELNKTSLLKGSRESGNVLLKWSPAKDKLLTFSDGIVFRIWNCQTWESERWTLLSGRVQGACWSNCGSHLIFATSTEPIIYGLTVRSDDIFTTKADSSTSHAVPIFDLAKIDLDGVGVGGIVQLMETDPKGNHLAVSFKDTNCVALFNVIKAPMLQLIPSSLITGFSNQFPTTIGFQQNFVPGACLTIGWSTGRIQHFPIIYTDLASDFHTNQGSQASIRNLSNSR